MFRKLAAKYNVPSPLDGMNRHAVPSTGTSQVQSPNFGSTMPSSTPSRFGNTTPGPSPFSSIGPTVASPFGAPKITQSTTPFGNPSASNATASAGVQTFGTASLSAPSPFSQSASSLAQPSPFGGSLVPAPKFMGKTPRELLVQFYQQKNPTKISEVDKLLEKYRGNEELMFRNLAKKYQLDPSVFGLSAGGGFGSTPAQSTGGFGAASASNPGGFASTSGTNPGGFGAASSGAGFGQPSVLGGGPTFGGGPSPFGQNSSFGSGGQSGGQAFGSSSTPGGMGTSHTFGAASTPAFGASGFGALAHSSSPSPFGSPPGGFATAGFGSSPGGFGSSTPFGAPRR